MKSIRIKKKLPLIILVGLGICLILLIFNNYNNKNYKFQDHNEKKVVARTTECLQKNYVYILPVASKDKETASRTIGEMLKHFHVKKIVVITNKNVKFTEYNSSKKVEILDEDSLYPNLNYSRVKEIGEEVHNGRTGWFFQQFLKMAYCKVTPDDNYIIWDSDCVPLRNIKFQDESGKPIFYTTEEFYTPYFNLINTLFGGTIGKVCPKSFIAEHMIIKAKFMRELIADIENNKALKGNNFFEKIFYATVNNHEPCTFSEYETYGSYVSIKHPKAYRIMENKNFRNGTHYCINVNDRNQLKWVSEKYDSISFEKSDTREDCWQNFVSDKLFREQYSFGMFVNDPSGITKMYLKS